MPPKKKREQVAAQKPPSAEVINFYELSDVQAFNNDAHNPFYNVHNIKVPFRAIVVGASGSGKSNLVLNLLHQLNSTFNKIELYCRSNNEPLYRYLETKMADEGSFKIEEGLENFNKQNLNEAYKKDDQTLIIFDDIVLEKDQSKICEMYIRGRKLGCSLVYLTQKYFKVPTPIRGQANYIFLKKIAGRGDLKRILSETSLSAPIDAIFNMYQFCLKHSFQSFLLIDLESPEERQYRCNFDIYLNWREFV